MPSAAGHALPSAELLVSSEVAEMRFLHPLPMTSAETAKPSTQTSADIVRFIGSTMFIHPAPLSNPNWNRFHIAGKMTQSESHELLLRPKLSAFMSGELRPKGAAQRRCRLRCAPFQNRAQGS